MNKVILIALTLVALQACKKKEVYQVVYSCCYANSGSNNGKKSLSYEYFNPQDIDSLGEDYITKDFMPKFCESQSMMVYKKKGKLEFCGHKDYTYKE